MLSSMIWDVLTTNGSSKSCRKVGSVAGIFPILIQSHSWTIYTEIAIQTGRTREGGKEIIQLYNFLEDPWLETLLDCQQLLAIGFT